VTELVGRQAELEATERFLDALSDGLCGVVLEGEAGIGKTTLWQAVAGRAAERSVRVLACRTAQAETRLSFASLADLLAEVGDDVFDALPLPQRRALEVALLRVEPTGRPPDQRAVSTALVSLLTELARSGPVVVAIDDVQWLDRPSGRVLEFAIRRLGRQPVGLLLSLRVPPETGVPVALDEVLRGDRVERLRVGPLTLAALQQLLKARLGQALPRPTLGRVHRASGGNPFFALEIGRALLRQGLPAPGEPLPVPDDLRQLVADRIGRLPLSTRRALVAAAAMPDPTLAALTRAVEGSSAGTLRALAPAEADGIIEVAGEGVRFNHPLFAAAVYSAEPVEERRRLHRRLAEVVPDTEERARHLGFATDRPDEAVCTALDEAVGVARVRGALDAAAELAELAASLTPEDAAADGQRRWIDAAECLFLAGDRARAEMILADLVQRLGRSPDRVRALLLQSHIVYWTRDAPAAVACCEEALLDAAGNQTLEAKCHIDLAAYLDFDIARSETHARAALALLEAPGAEADTEALSEALAMSVRNRLVLGHGLDIEAAERAVLLESQSAPASFVADRTDTQLGQWLKYVDDFDGARARLEKARGTALEEGDESSLPNILMHLALTECWSGYFELAASYARQSCEIAEELGHSAGGPPAYRALVDAHLGHTDAARASVEAWLPRVERNPLALPLHLRVLGFLELSLGDAQAAEKQLSRAVEVSEASGILEPGVLRIHADATEALIAIGELERAAALLGRLEKRGRAVGLAWSCATAHRCRGLLHAAQGELDDALAALDAALAEHERLPMPLERARTLLVKGQIERRAKQRGRARESLGQALASFEQLGAPLWAAKTRAELRRIGPRPSGSDELTPTEQQVGELAAAGLTNREIASAVFVSPKTVEANLARIYRKLGIHSRAELGARMAERARAGSEAM